MIIIQNSLIAVQLPYASITGAGAFGYAKWGMVIIYFQDYLLSMVPVPRSEHRYLIVVVFALAFICLYLCSIFV